MDFPHMLNLAGQVANVFISRRGTNKDGDSFGGASKVQIIAYRPAEDGSHQLEILDIKTDRAADFERLKGQWISLPVGVWTNGGTWGFYAVRGATPEVLSFDGGLQL